jgi:phosphoglycerate dehydrogenase-like enzyme
MTPNVFTIYSNAKLDDDANAALGRGCAPHKLIMADANSVSNLHEGAPDPAIAEADVAFGQPSVKDILDNERLRFIQLTAAGYDRYDTPEVKRALKSRGGFLCNASSVYAEPCAEHVLVMMLASARRLPEALRVQFGDHSYPKDQLRLESNLMLGQSVLIVGYGMIAQRLVELLTPFKMRIAAVRRTLRGDELVNTFPQSQLDSLLPDADHVVNILPGGGSTEKMFDAKRFAKMKPSAIFYNIGRGSTVDQPALIDAMQRNQIAAAYLDVTTPEPLPPDHALWTLPNVCLTPHTAGGFSDEFAAHVRQFLHNLHCFANHKDPIDRVI